MKQCFVNKITKPNQRGEMLLCVVNNMNESMKEVKFWTYKQCAKIDEMHQS